MHLIPARDIRAALTWESAVQALSEGHRGAQPKVQDLLINDAAFTLFGRGVILPGHGAGMKIASIFPPNADRPVPTPVEDAAFVVVDEDSKRIRAILDGPELTRWKTAADSALGARLLSREDSATLLVIGAGPVAFALAEAHLHVRPSLTRVLLWNRTQARLRPLAERLSAEGHADVQIVTDLARALAEADIISSATGVSDPLIAGALLKPGAHVDLVGGFTPRMREADDTTITRATVFVDYRATTIEKAGDICQPIADGILTPDAVRGDLFDLIRAPHARAADEITLFKNAGGAHIDLLVAAAVLARAPGGE